MHFVAHLYVTETDVVYSAIRFRSGATGMLWDNFVFLKINIAKKGKVERGGLVLCLMLLNLFFCECVIVVIFTNVTSVTCDGMKA